MSEESQARTYKLSIEAIAILEEMQDKFSRQTRIKFSMTKILELIIYYTEHASLEQLTRQRD